MTADLPSFTEQLAVVYDEYLDTLGGGERSALAYALALQNLGFTTELVSTRQIPSKEEITRLFGHEFSGLNLKKIDSKDLYSYYKPSQLTVFVNHTHMSLMPNPAKLGIYSQMFPAEPVTMENNPKAVAQLNSYKLFLSNSSFTQKYSELYWQYPKDRGFVLHPPIGSDHIKTALSLKEDLASLSSQKKKQFLHIGRFNPGHHNKNQKIIIESFLEARAKDLELKDWQLHLVGVANQTKEAISYLEQCRALAKKHGGIVFIHNDISSSELSRLLLESSGYVHGTGAFYLPGEHPERCEHLGLAIIEAAAHGCVPLVYARGGIFDLLTPGETCIPYISKDGLIEGYSEVAHLVGSEGIGKIRGDLLTATLNCGQEAFTRKLSRYIVEALQS